MIVAGQAKSHCVAWTVEDLLAEVRARDPRLARSSCCSTTAPRRWWCRGSSTSRDAADAAFARFAAAGIHLARTTEPLEAWPGLGP